MSIIIPTPTIGLAFQHIIKHLNKFRSKLAWKGDVKYKVTGTINHISYSPKGEEILCHTVVLCDKPKGEGYHGHAAADEEDNHNSEY